MAVQPTVIMWWTTELDRNVHVILCTCTIRVRFCLRRGTSHSQFSGVLVDENPSPLLFVFWFRSGLLGSRIGCGLAEVYGEEYARLESIIFVWFRLQCGVKFEWPFFQCCLNIVYWLNDINNSLALFYGGACVSGRGVLVTEASVVRWKQMTTEIEAWRARDCSAVLELVGKSSYALRECGREVSECGREVSCVILFWK